MCQLFFPNFRITINLIESGKRSNITGISKAHNGKDLVPLSSVIECYSRLRCKMKSVLPRCRYLTLAILIERLCDQKL